MSFAALPQHMATIRARLASMAAQLAEAGWKEAQGRAVETDLGIEAVVSGVDLAGRRKEMSMLLDDPGTLDLQLRQMEAQALAQCRAADDARWQP